MTEAQAKNIVLTGSILFSAGASCFFTLLGAGVANEGVGFSPLVSLPLFLWGEWGVFWGGFCGWFWGERLIRRLKDTRNPAEGLKYGLFTGVMIGTVNALLTGTFPFGFVLGLFMGPGFGLLVAVLGMKVLPRDSDVDHRAV